MLEQNMKSLRKANHMSQKELASMLFVSPQAVSKWERGESTPNPETLVRMATIFDISVDELLGYSLAQQIESEEITKAAIPKDDGPAEEDARLLHLLRNSDPDLKKAMIEFLEKAQK